MHMRYVVIDIGNTSTSAALVEGRRLLRRARMPSRDGRRPAAIRALLQRLAGAQGLGDAVLCSVVPALNPAWTRVLARRCGRSPIVVGHRTRMKVRVDYPHPATIGADRLANAAAGWERYHGPVIVADFGTALTFDVVTGDGRYVGGVIAPGLPLMTDYLAERTALLPHIRLGGRFGAFGRSTREAMRVGSMVGYRGMVREILDHIKTGLADQPVHFCATGGYAALALKGLDVPVDILPDLTLEGLVLIRELNRSGED
jgi:type III pantothenate kinase